MKATLILAAASLVAAQSTVYFIRHGEKPADGSDGLSPQGEQRAQCLRDVFGASSQYNIGYIMAETPSSAITTITDSVAFGTDGSHQRPFDTISPLAADLGITVDTSWEHEHLTDLIAKLGDDDAPEYPGDHFDLIWTDPYPYTSIVSTTSENCPGLDS
ncbi:hypothetical protein NQ176_g5811 [Zarea fungicola]|uniref:Uncharacterized protein n=1 Tax=Zarea fungicola TaxID=93591 RepID=A0ACC1N6N9_9HYPO|nr:hypothetical protein NQ176_g5811 [Lecanicillium fungicola]